MKNQKSDSRIKLISNSIIYSLSGLLLKCFSFFLLPLYTAYLTTEDYGITSISASFITTFSFIVAFSLFSAVMRFYVDLKNDSEDLKRFYGTIITFVFLTSAFFGVIATIFRDLISKYVFSGADYYPIILITLISLTFYCQQTIYMNILQSQQKAMKFSVLNIIFFFVSLALNIIFVVVLKMGAVGSLIASMIGYILYTVYFISDMIIHKKLIFCIDIKLLKDSLKYSIPIMPHNLSTQLSMLISKVLIGGKVSMAGVGVYAIASQFGNIADTIQCYVDQAYGPWLYEKLHDKEENFRDGIRNLSRMLTSVLGIFFLGIALFAQDYILLFVDKSYADAWRYVPLIVMTFAIKTAYYFYVEVLFYYKEASKKLFVATLTGSVVNILLSFYLVPIFGVYGSIIADAIAMVIRVGIIIVISKKFDNVGLYVIDFVKSFIEISIAIGIGLFLSYFKYGNTFSLFNFGYKCVIVLLYVIFIFIQYRKSIIPWIDNKKMQKLK